MGGLENRVAGRGGKAVHKPVNPEAQNFTPGFVLELGAEIGAPLSVVILCSDLRPPVIRIEPPRSRTGRGEAGDFLFEPAQGLLALSHGAQGLHHHGGMVVVTVRERGRDGVQPCQRGVQAGIVGTGFQKAAGGLGKGAVGMPVPGRRQGEVEGGGHGQAPVIKV